MKIQRLKLKNYRNYDQLNLELNDGLTIITGENAQGKTNLLEAIFLLSMAKSHRTNHDNELIQWGQTYAQIEGEIVTANYKYPLSLYLGPKGKSAKFNYIEQPKLSHFIGKLNVILFAPEDLQLIKGSPSVRRKFIDAELGQSHPIYLQELVEYNRVLKQRNRYLKSHGQSSQFDELYFEIITKQLITQAIEVITYRTQFIEAIASLSQPILQDLSTMKDKLTIEYNSSSSKLNYKDIDTLEAQFHDVFQRALNREKEQGITVYGPHRDDITFYINDKDAQQFASQGQQRSIVLSLKLAEIDWLYRNVGEYPVLLLDDVLSELDDDRQFKLMSYIEDKVQTILTTASIEGLQIHQLKNASLLYVNDGMISYQKEGE